ncbi:MAG: glycerol-3-phosphate dehydrogenase/oxidase [Stagnimonas sp.]|nr:glycerol-3-phosphate dehydrogenase/oxidase [Stagnimonas sp.]
MVNAFPLLRDVEGLKNKRFDVLVIGGGIYGVWAAYDAALRGLSVALIEKTDWGSGTSQSSSKLIHGGLRYLEHFEFRLVSHALKERRVLSEIAPHLVRPLNFKLPVWKTARVGRLQLLAGLTLYDFLATGKQPVPRHKSFSREALLQEHPYLNAEGLRGGLRYGDCQEDDARMAMVVAAAAQGAGAICATGIAAESLLDVQGRVTGAEVRDMVSGERFAIHAEVTINAAGPWARALTASALGEAAPVVKLVKGIHLVLPHIPGLQDAFLLTAPQDGRVFFVIPWYGRTLLGTTESSVADVTQAVVTPAEQTYLLDAVRMLMPGLGWTDADVISGFAGARTLQAEDADSLSAQTREFAITTPRPGLIWPIGGKYTTARCDAAEVIDAVYALLEKPGPVSLTHRYPLPGAPVGTREGSVMLGDFTGWQTEAVAGLERRGLARDIAESLTLRHGTRIGRILALLDEEPAWAARLVDDAPFIEAEVILAVRDEGARTVEDISRRRMPLALISRTGSWQARIQALCERA